MARLSCDELLVTYQDMHPQIVTHPSTNRARRKATTLIATNVLQLRQTANRCLQSGSIAKNIQVAPKHPNH